MPRPSSCFLAVAGLMASCSLASAVTIPFTGSFIFDDDVAFFQFQSPLTDFVTVSTSSFASGGFAPMLALYDSSGLLLFTADGVALSDCSIAGPDLAPPGGTGLGTGLCYDTAITWNATAGVNYYVALSEYDNLANPSGILPVTQPVNTWNNPSTFPRSGDPDFTTESPFGPGCGQSGFCLNTGEARGQNFALTFTGPDGLLAGPAVPAPIPETSSIFLLLGGLAILVGKVLASRKRTAPSSPQEPAS